jgi:hypothetical protein
MTTTPTDRRPGDRFTGQTITPELLRAEATRLDAINSGGGASWDIAEAACLLRRTADQLSTVDPDAGGSDPLADWPAADIDPEPTDVWDLCRQWDREANGR